MVSTTEMFHVSAFAAYSKNRIEQKAENKKRKSANVEKSDKINVSKKPKVEKQTKKMNGKTVENKKRRRKDKMKQINEVKDEKEKVEREKMVDTNAGGKLSNGDAKKKHRPETVETPQSNGTVKSKTKLSKKARRKSIVDFKEIPEIPSNNMSVLPTQTEKGDKPDQSKSNKSEAEQLFNWLISPIKPHDFMSTFWEKKSAYFKRDSANYYKHIFSTEIFDKILREHALMYTTNVDVVSYSEGVKEVFNQEGRATPSALWDYYSNGCSIRLLNPHTYHNKVHLLLSTLQEYFGSMVGANVYLTPAGSQGFAPHFDDIEAFVLQLEGRKHWKLYNPK